MNVIVRRINELRKKQGLSQAALADAIGINVNSVYNWNRTEAMPSLKNLESICKTFNITVEQFFNGLGNENGESSEEKFLDAWRMLTDSEKSAIEKVITAFKEDKAVLND